MIAAARWCLLLAAVHQRPGGQIVLVVVAGALADFVSGRLRPGGHQSGV